MLALESLSRLEKLRIMEALWDDLTRSEASYASPDWHGEVLSATEAAVRAGEVDFVDWEHAKDMLRKGRR